MRFSEMFDSLVAEIAECGGLSKEDVAKVLMKHRESNRPDFSMFMNTISENPEEAAAALGTALGNLHSVCDITVRGSVVGFNLVKDRILSPVVRRILTEDTAFGTSTAGSGHKVVVDFSSPNIAKIFHIGHFRTTVLGNFVVRLLRGAAYDVVALNYLGDWGKQFGLVLLGYERYGDEEALRKDPLSHLFDIYVRISKEAKDDPSIDSSAREIFREMEEEKNERYLAQWRRFRSLSITKYKSLYAQLGISFDVYSGESEHVEAAKAFMADHSDLVTRDEDGSYVVDCGKAGKALVQKRDGTTLYLTRDIAAAEDRIQRYEADHLFYVVADEQNRHFQQLFVILDRLGHKSSMFRHLGYGLVKGMSTRNGTAHFLEDIIESSAEVIDNKLLSGRDISDRLGTARNLALTTLLIADFTAKRGKGYTFNIEQRANCEAGSGAYLQYAHVRLLSIERHNSDVLVDPDVDLHLVAEAGEFVYRLFWYEHVLELCLVDFEPSRIVGYLMDVCKAANSLVGKLRVAGECPSLASARLAVFKAARIVIGNGLTVLGITPLEKM